MPVLADQRILSEGGHDKMGRVIVGVDPHKKSVMIEVVDADGQVLATGRFDTTSPATG